MSNQKMRYYRQIDRRMRIEQSSLQKKVIYDIGKSGETYKTCLAIIISFYKKLLDLDRFFLVSVILRSL